MRRGYKDWLKYEDEVHYTWDSETAVSERFKMFTLEAFYMFGDGGLKSCGEDNLYCLSFEHACRLVNHWNRSFGARKGDWFYRLKP